MAASAKSLGARVLGEVEVVNLEEVLIYFQAAFTTPTTTTSHSNPNNPNLDPVPGINPPNPRQPLRIPSFPDPFSPLAELLTQHSRATQSPPRLAVSGRYKELVYPLIATLIMEPNCMAVAVVDLDGTFDVLRLLATKPLSQGWAGEGSAGESSGAGDGNWACHDSETERAKVRITKEDLSHVHILRPPLTKSQSHFSLTECLISIENYMLYSPHHKSHCRQWWGTIILGDLPSTSSSMSTLSMSSQATATVTAGRRGWLRVDRADANVLSFGGMSVEEAMEKREIRQGEVERAAWVVSSAWGRFTFGGGG